MDFLEDSAIKLGIDISKFCIKKFYNFLKTKVKKKEFKKLFNSWDDNKKSIWFSFLILK